MANKTVHQEFDTNAVAHFGIDCDPYGIAVDSECTIETVYISESNSISNNILEILEGSSLEPDMTLYKKAFLFPNAPVSQERVKAALKEHKITLTNNYEDADLYITHEDLSRDARNGENINTRAMLSELWNFDAVEEGNTSIDLYCNKNMRNGELARVIYDLKVENFDNYGSFNRHSMPYDSWMLTGLAVNAAYEIEVNNKACYNVDKIMHQSATKCELTLDLIQDIKSQLSQGDEGKSMVGAILPTIDYTKKKYLLWQLSQEIGHNLYYFNRNKDVQYWLNASNFDLIYRYTALEMILSLEQKNMLDKETFSYLEPIVRKEVTIQNRELYTFRVEVKPEYKKLI